MTWSVRDDKFTFIGLEEAIGHVDGDPLFTLGAEAIDKERKIDLSRLSAKALRLFAERL